jgi:hypothetical protein
MWICPRQSLVDHYSQLCGISRQTVSKAGPKRTGHTHESGCALARVCDLNLLYTAYPLACIQIVRSVYGDSLTGRVLLTVNNNKHATKTCHPTTDCPNCVTNTRTRVSVTYAHTRNVLLYARHEWVTSSRHYVRMSDNVWFL